MLKRAAANPHPRAESHLVQELVDITQFSRLARPGPAGRWLSHICSLLTTANTGGESVGDEAAGEFEERFVDVNSPLPVDA